MFDWTRLEQPVRVKVDLSEGLTERREHGKLVQGDKNANAIVAEIYQTANVPYNLTGCTVTLNFVRPDGLAVPPITAEIGGENNNIAVATLTDTCYLYNGMYVASLKIKKGEPERTVVRIIGDVISTENNGIVDDEQLFPSPEELLAVLKEIENKTASAVAEVEAKGAETLASIPADYTALAGEVSRLSAEMITKAPAIECEVSGRIVSVTDAAAQPAVSLISHIEPVQEGEGDPSPDNIRPISGWTVAKLQRTRKNMLNPEMQSAEGEGDFRWHEVDGGVLLRAGVTYTFSVYDVSEAPNGIYFIQADNDATLSAAYDAVSVSFTPQYDIFAWCYAIWSRGQSGNVYANVKGQLELGPTATPYEPYQGQTLTADLSETVYGGTLDWGTGVLTVEYAKILLKNLNFKYVSVFNGSFTAAISRYTPNVGTIISDIYKTITSKPEGYDMIVYGRNNSNNIYIKDSRYTDVDAFISNVGDHYVVYSLVNPYTIQLTPQQLDMLKGTNNVWSDTGDTSLVYVADTKMYIDQKLAAIAAATVKN